MPDVVPSGSSEQEGPDTRSADLLPPSYRILPVSIPLRIPGFRSVRRPENRTLALRDRDCEAWFHEFVDHVVGACGRTYLPVCRMSDGEFRFVLGDPPINLRLPAGVRRRKMLTRLVRKMTGPRHVEALTRGRYHSGRYTADEWLAIQERYARWLREISRSGVLALHLSYGERPFQEHYFPGLAAWMRQHDIQLNDRNYVPFYFVYGALTGPRRHELLSGRRVAVVTAGAGERREKIEAGLRREGVTDVEWIPLSAERSLFDVIDPRGLIGSVDLALVGAGIGKPNILRQLEPLGVPCIDAGFVFEVWADPAAAVERPVCLPD